MTITRPAARPSARPTPRPAASNGRFRPNGSSGLTGPTTLTKLTTLTEPAAPAAPTGPGQAAGSGAAKPAKDQRRRELGARGEAVAADWLRQHGLDILDQNWRGPAGEIDLVARDAATLVVVEVKTRSGTGFGAATAAVTASKYARLRRLAAQWIDQHEVHPDDIRIDVVGIVLRPGRAPEIEHIVGAYR